MPFGFEKVLRGIIKYRITQRSEMVAQFRRVQDHPTPTAVFFTCVDSRMLPTRFTQTCVGDMLIVRSAGNLVPHSCLYDACHATTEPAVLELGCVTNNVSHVVICGHSDCKAINTLYKIKDNDTPLTQLGPLQAWMKRHGASSLEHFRALEKEGYNKPLQFEAELPNKKFVAYIDPDNKFSVEDKLSQVNCLQQLQNVASYGFLRTRLEKGNLHLHALWFDIYTGDIYYFSRKRKKFIEIKGDTLDSLLDEVAEQSQH